MVNALYIRGLKAVCNIGEMFFIRIFGTRHQENHVQKSEYSLTYMYNVALAVKHYTLLFVNLC